MKPETAKLLLSHVLGSLLAPDFRDRVDILDCIAGSLVKSDQADLLIDLLFLKPENIK